MADYVYTLTLEDSGGNLERALTCVDRAWSGRPSSVSKEDWCGINLLGYFKTKLFLAASAHAGEQASMVEEAKGEFLINANGGGKDLTGTLSEQVLSDIEEGK